VSVVRTDIIVFAAASTARPPIRRKCARGNRASSDLAQPASCCSHAALLLLK
jgi:hypothetical protein